MFNEMWSDRQRVIVGGFTPPKFKLPDNFTFYQIDKVDYPADRWSNALIKMLSAFPDPFILLMLEDYWLRRKVDQKCVSVCRQYMEHRPRILRIDLTDDRQYSGGVYDIDTVDNYDIIETPPGTPYQFSTQAGIWNKSLLLELLQPNKTAWETEIHTAPPGRMRVLGTRQKPISYANAMLKGEIDRTEIIRLPQVHREFIKKWIPEEMTL
jgi:hypothetical protein